MIIIKTSAALISIFLYLSTPVLAQQNNAVKIGVLSDIGGPYSDVTGPGSITAAKMAIEDMGGNILGNPVELVSADHKHKPDLGSSIARRWFDAESVDAIFDIYNSGVALAVQKLAEEKDKILISTVNSGKLTGDSCSTHGFQWGPDGYSLATITVKGVQGDKKSSWYFMTVDYTAGHSLEGDASRTVEELGGSVKGHVRFPLGTTDFSSFLLRAQASKADYIGFIGGGSDLANATKQSNEFQIQATNQKFMTTSLTTADIIGLGSDITSGLPIVYSFYWNQSPESRAWADRFYKIQGTMPTDMQANVYSAVTHYLKSVKQAGTTETAAVLKTMKELPVNDFYTSDAHIRDDGRLMRDIYFGWVKAPSEKEDEYDLIDIVDTFSGEESFISASLSECHLLTN